MLLLLLLLNCSCLQQLKHLRVETLELLARLLHVLLLWLLLLELFVSKQHLHLLLSGCWQSLKLSKERVGWLVGHLIHLLICLHLLLLELVKNSLVTKTLEKSKLLLDVVGWLLATEALHLVDERCKHLGVLNLLLPWQLLFEKKLRYHGLYSDLHVGLA